MLLSEKSQLKPSVIQTNNTVDKEDESVSEQTNPQIDDAKFNQLIGKKRTYEEAQQISKSEEPSFDDLLHQIRNKVLIGETLNNFKKEINLIVELIEERDPKLDRLVDTIGKKLANILQKPESEMQMMLRRTHYMNQKKAKKSEIDKTCAMLRSAIEKRLVDCNSKSDQQVNLQ